MKNGFRLLRKKRITIPLVLIAIFVLLFGISAWLIGNAYFNDPDERRSPAAGTADDASRINATAIADRADVPPDDAMAFPLLRSLLARARASHMSVSIAGARHSMGGQTIAPNGLQINMLNYSAMSYDPATELIHVQAGATWAQVLAFLDPLRRSVAIMQSDNDFSVGGSLSVNCHGWQYARPPISSSVKSLRLMLADGSIKNCSRTDNPELFSLALGGYGLFGVILDADLHTVPNEYYEIQQFLQPTTDFFASTRAHISSVADIRMAFGRLSIEPDHLMEYSLLYVMRNTPPPVVGLPQLGPSPKRPAVRAVFKASADSDAGKALRWSTESHLFSWFSTPFFSRNQLLNESTEVYANRTDATTHILQEYFIPTPQLGTFLGILRRLVPTYHANLLNVTLRDVRKDNETFLHYTNDDTTAVVLLYQIPRKSDIDPAFITLSRESIDAALACGGCYYLPYRLDATPEQFHRAYPMADDFFKKKKEYDPTEIFQNSFYIKYKPATPTSRPQVNPLGTLQ